MNILAEVRRQKPNLSRAEAQIAEAVLDSPEKVVNMTTAELARKAGVSDPMISRFCRSFSFGSFPALKLRLAQDLAASPTFISESVEADDDVVSVIDKRIGAGQSALEYIRSELDPQAIEKAVELLSNAHQILIFGMGASSAIAQDAQHKLFRLGTPVVAHADALMQRMAAAGSTHADCLLIVSFTGRTAMTIESAKLAQNNGTPIVAITASGSPLANLADVVIPSGHELEDTTLYVPMTARIVVLTLIDILATSLALAQGGAGSVRLRTIKESLEATKV